MKTAPTALLALLIFPSRPAAALPVYKVMFEAKYNYPVNCTLCHRRDTLDLVAYGRAFYERANSFKAFEAIEDLDSDRDGASNLSEINAKSDPSDETSFPGRLGRWLNGVAALQAPSTQLRKLFPEAGRFEARSGANLDEETGRRIELTLGASLRDEDLYSVYYLAFGKNDAALGSALYCVTQGQTPYIFLLGLRSSGRIAGLLRVKAPAKRKFLRQFQGISWRDLDGIEAIPRHFQAGARRIVEAVRRGALILSARTGAPLLDGDPAERR